MGRHGRAYHALGRPNVAAEYTNFPIKGESFWQNIVQKFYASASIHPWSYDRMVSKDDEVRPAARGCTYECEW